MRSTVKKIVSSKEEINHQDQQKPLDFLVAESSCNVRPGR